MDARSMIIRRELQSRRLPCRLTEEEKIERCRDMAGAIGEQAEEQARVDNRAEALKLAKENLAHKAGRVASIGKVISSGTETRDVECRTILDYDKKTVVTQRTDTEAVVFVRNMNDSELQAEIYEDGQLADVETVRAAIQAFFNRGGDEAALTASGAEGEE